MNLIEQLGGYEQALDLFRGCPWDSGTVDVPNPRLKGMLRLELSELSSELLEYRRQHNIFEVGDKVVLISMSDNEVFEYTEYSKGLDLHFFESAHNYGHAKLSDIRHVTDEEIKAGKRLGIE